MANIKYQEERINYGGRFSLPLEKNKAIVRKFFEDFNKRNLDKIAEFTAPDYVDHTHQFRGVEASKQFLEMLIKVLDFRMDIEDVIAEGDMVWVRLKGTGKHIAEWRGIAPTGKKITETAVHIFRIVNGKNTEGWSVSDSLDLYRKLGVIEYTEKGKQLFPEGTP